MSSDNETMEQLALLREFTRMTNMLHEAQVLQIKMWPKVLFGAECEAKTTLNVEQSTLETSITTHEKVTRLKKRSETLSEWLVAMLGEEWSIKVVVNGKTYHKRTGVAPKRTFDDTGENSFGAVRTGRPKVSISEY